MFFSYQAGESCYDITLSPEESAHALKVLRLQICDVINITDGLGTILLAEITKINNNIVTARIISKQKVQKQPPSIHIAFCPVKKRDRIEWLIEKLTEIGVDEITFFQSENSERTQINYDRLEKLCIASIKQSLNPFMPKINPLVNYKDLLSQMSDFEGNRLIAWCPAGNEDHLSNAYKAGENAFIMIGPEGDFTVNEVEPAKVAGFLPVSLGKNRLRSETAAIYAAIAFKTINAIL